MELTVDLQREDGHGRGPRGALRRRRLHPLAALEGLDDIGLTLRHEEDITAYEKTRPSHKPTTLA